MINNNEKKANANKYSYSLISIFISIIMFLLIINFFMQIVDINKIQGFPLLISPIIGLFGIIIGAIGIKSSGRNILSVIGVILNSILIIFPILYWILGTIIWGP